MSEFFEYTTPIQDHTFTGTTGRMVDTLIELEEIHHRFGWDGLPPILYNICEGEIDDILSSPSELGIHGISAAEELFIISQGMKNIKTFSDEAMDRFHAAYSGPILCHCVIMESWMNSTLGDSGEDFEKFRAGRSLADIPGSLESRDVIAIVEEDTKIWISRVRGTDPVLYPVNNPAFASGGLMWNSLVDLHNAAREVMKSSS